MIAKTLIATAAVAGAMALTLPAAQAKSNVDVTIGIGVGGYDPYYGYGGYGGYGGYPNHSYDYGYVGYEHYDDGISCRQGRKIVSRSGFRDVRSISCEGPSYKYSGWRHGRQFVIRVNGEGKIVRIRRID